MIKKRRSHSDNIGRAVLFVLAGLVLAYMAWFFATHKKVDIDIYTPINEAKQNPYLAATLILKQQGKTGEYIKPTDASERLIPLWQDTQNAQGQAVVIENMGTVPPHQLEQMVAWIRAGGHLVIYSQAYFYEEGGDWDTYAQRENPLMVHLGLSYRNSNAPSLADNPLQLPEHVMPIRMDNQLLIVSGALPWRFELGSFLDNYPDARPVQNYRAIGQAISNTQIASYFAVLDSTQRQQLMDLSANNPSYGDPAHALIDVYLGEGRLTVLNESIDFHNPWLLNQYQTVNERQNNQNPPDNTPRLLKLWRGDGYTQSDVYHGGITSYDHAYFFRQLTKDSQTVWFVSRNLGEPMGILAILREHLLFVLIASVMAIAVMLLSLPRQFGRQLRLLDDSQTNLMLYFDGVGQYLWHTDLCVAQVAANRSRLFEKIEAKLPKIAVLGNEACCQLISEDSNLPASMVYEALYATWQNQSEFVKVSRSFAHLSAMY